MRIKRKFRFFRPIRFHAIRSLSQREAKSQHPEAQPTDTRSIDTRSMVGKAKSLFLPRSAIQKPGRDQWVLVGFAFLVLAGVLAGALTGRVSADSGTWVTRFVDSYRGGRSGGSFGAVFWMSLKPLLLYFAAMLLAGTSFIGGLTLVPMLFFRGLGLGLTLACMYQAGTSQMLLCALVLVLPHGFCTTVVLLLEARESLRTSYHLARSVWKPKEHMPPIREKLRRYAQRSAILLAGLCALALLDAALSVLIL